jgi:hypothetical protein
MVNKKPRRRKLARIRALVERSDVILPRLEMTLLGDDIPLGHVMQAPADAPVRKVTTQFEFPCPCCGKGISGEIVGRL